MAFQSGSINLGRGYFGVSTADWNLLATVGGQRTFTQAISFDTEFSETPTVVAMLKSFHIQQSEDPRIAVGVSDESNTGFNLIIQTWHDTSVVGVGVTWMAYDSGSAL
jgi:hypothetical protein